MKKLIIILMVFLSIVEVNAQQDAQFTHYMFNTLAVNPGYAGSREALTVTGLYRNQWTGFDGAPKTLTLTAHTPLLNDKVGLGLSLMKDQIGPTDNYSVYADFAYRIAMGQSKKARLTFGLKGGFDIRQFSLSGVSRTVINDDNFTKFDKTISLGNIGFGVYYYTNTFYIGGAVPRIIENYFDKDAAGVISGANAREKRHYTLIVGAMTKLGKSVNLKPSLLVRIGESTPPMIDLSALFYLADKKFWIGPAFRTAFKSSDAVSGLIGFKLFNALSIGYSFDYSLGVQTVKHNGGSHELMLRYDFIFNNNKTKVLSPRYF